MLNLTSSSNPATTPSAEARQRRLYDIPSRFVKTIGPDPVHIDPDETSAVWAYDFAWHPAPIFQTYSVYTPALDKLNRDTLAAGPQFVLSLRSATSPATGINGRLGVQENPLYSRALLCDFRRSAVEDHWALFTHTQPGADRSPRSQKSLSTTASPSRCPNQADRTWPSWSALIWSQPSSTGFSWDRSFP
ncbi:hypothetical protein I551_2441 [Mycobacterium ulcerans str. Harvey]|uniref:Uncharacterized protein n=1 Tax=Mycobacterium ulcerans str. Harvey TaxID=1299332 RepID=A0ABP3AMK8_MYCUL|nr:hypothetical protein I551_2441 [Mycobacterium ulcerans str. Harvey]